ncbi:hypothetical protein [Clostridium polynesiense]|uniref:hypothetical protein n=1 Tax=Clostridium polynesiense TaxID=1325933 RepID=UPI000693E17A|nr:hypothetical protein [Clostridium polynesiense]
MKKSVYLAKGGLLTALSVIILYLTFIFPTNKLTLLTLSSVMIPISILTMDIRHAILVYLSTSLIAFLFGLKSIFILYLLFFGPYGIVKLFIERYRNTIVEIGLKLLFFNLDLFFVYILAKSLILQYFNIQIPIIYVVLTLQIVFLSTILLLQYL